MRVINHQKSFIEKHKNFVREKNIRLNGFCLKMFCNIPCFIWFCTLEERYEFVKEGLNYIVYELGARYS